MRLAVLLGACLTAAAVAQPLVLRYLPGADYQVIAQPVETAGDAIPVIEFFVYSCPHCYDFDPAIRHWRKTLADDVAFRRVPVLFGAGGRFYARLFYTAKALGVLDRLHAKIFEAIHRQGRDLSNFAVARAFFEAHGVDGARFAEVLNSPAIDHKVARAARLARTFRIRVVPSLGVAGRYRVSAAMTGSNAATLDVAEYLIAKTRAAQAQ